MLVSCTRCPARVDADLRAKRLAGRVVCFTCWQQSLRWKLHQRAAELADEITQLRALSYHSDDDELKAEMRELDRVSRSRKTGKRAAPWDELQEKAKAEIKPAIEAEIRVNEEYRANLQAQHAIRPRYDELNDLALALADRELELADRETNVAAREKESSPSYRTSMIAIGAGLALSADVLIRAVA